MAKPSDDLRGTTDHFAWILDDINGQAVLKRYTCGGAVHSADIRSFVGVFLVLLGACNLFSRLVKSGCLLLSARCTMKIVLCYLGSAVRATDMCRGILARRVVSAAMQ